MKKIFLACLLFICLFFISGCGRQVNSNNSNNNYINVEANKDGKIVIDTESIGSDAAFVNYKVSGVTIQFIVVRGTDGVVRIAYNTCQACNPSPRAYFVQHGEYLVCQNCGNKFHIDKVGIEKGGCNPTVVEEKEVTDDKIILDKSYVDTYKDKFENWEGPISKIG